MSTLVSCEHCNKEIPKFDYQIKRCKSGIFFCSWDCQRTYRKAKIVMMVCQVCGKEFYAKPYRINNLTRTTSVTCSYQCKNIALGWGSQILNCDWCGKEFNRRNALINEHNFCSRKCVGQWQSVYRTGENSPSWCGGYEPYYGPNWMRQRRKARHRDNKTCQHCNLSEQDADHTLEVHHLKPFRLCQDYKEANKLANLITLCRDCHIKADVLARHTFD